VKSRRQHCQHNGFIISWPCCFDHYQFLAKAEYYGKNNTKYLEYQPLVNIPFLHAVTIVEMHNIKRICKSSGENITGTRTMQTTKTLQYHFITPIPLLRHLHAQLSQTLTDGCIYGIPTNAQHFCFYDDANDNPVIIDYTISSHPLPVAVASLKMKWLWGIIAHGQLWAI